jgi:DNA-binding transcriptional MerR regulator
MTFTSGEVATLLGVKRGTLTSWRVRGLLKVEKIHKQAWTIYSEADVERARVLRDSMRGFCPHCHKQFRVKP